jgi:Protein of unknown function (DUF3455)
LPVIHNPEKELTVILLKKRNAKITIAVTAASVAIGSLVTLTSANASPSDSGETAAPTAGEDVSAAVVNGVQIYSCQEQDDGTFAFAQENVEATLENDIQHSFSSPRSGPPQWRASDGSGITGTLVSKEDAGPGNIPTLVLNASPIPGSGEGLLSDVTEIRRENTSGGVAPEGTCDPLTDTTNVSVPYGATYVFVKG